MTKTKREKELEEILNDEVAQNNLDIMGGVEFTAKVISTGGSLVFLIPKNQKELFGIKSGQFWDIKAKRREKEDTNLNPKYTDELKQICAEKTKKFGSLGEMLRDMEKEE